MAFLIGNCPVINDGRCIDNIVEIRTCRIFDCCTTVSLGHPYRGGIYMGRITVGSTTYNLIVAPNDSGCALCQWKTTNTATSGTASLVNGHANTYGALNNATHPAGNWCATRTINGFSDWYLPAIDELQQFYNNGGTNEAVIGTGEAFASTNYWSSTENSALFACFFNFSNGSRFVNVKTLSYRLRAVRREPI